MDPVVLVVAAVAAVAEALAVTVGVVRVTSNHDKTVLAAPLVDLAAAVPVATTAVVALTVVLTLALVVLVVAEVLVVLADKAELAVPVATAATGVKPVETAAQETMVHLATLALPVTLVAQVLTATALMEVAAQEVHPVAAAQVVVPVYQVTLADLLVSMSSITAISLLSQTLAADLLLDVLNYEIYCSRNHRYGHHC